jgi:hypothetical protein
METGLKLDSQVDLPPGEWTPPQVECYETRPEVTAYSGSDDQWNRR